jgi:hypothetical protein
METLVGPYDRLEHPWDQWWDEYINGRRMPPAVVRKIREEYPKGEFTLFHRYTKNGKKGILAIPEGIKWDPGVARPRSYVTGLDPLNVDEMSWVEVTSRIALMEFQRFFKKHIPGFENSYMERIAGEFSYRTGRWIQNAEDLSDAELEIGAKNKDCIFVYQRTERAIDIIEVPYRSLLPRQVEGLLVIGKASGDQSGTNSRGILFQGQAAGTAAALATRTGVAPRQVDIKQLQSTLKTAGVEIPY